MSTADVTSAPLGSDFAGVFTLDRNLTIVTGRVCHVQDLARRLIQEPGSEPGDPTYGLGLWQLVGDDFDATNIEQGAEAQLLADERTLAARALATFDPTMGMVTLQCGVDDADGPFEFVVTTDRLTVDLILKRGF